MEDTKILFCCSYLCQITEPMFKAPRLQQTKRQQFSKPERKDVLHFWLNGKKRDAPTKIEIFRNG